MSLSIYVVVVAPGPTARKSYLVLVRLASTLIDNNTCLLYVRFRLGTQYGEIMSSVSLSLDMTLEGTR